MVVDLYPTFLNAGTTDETFQQSGKQEFFRHILKSSANMYESSGSQFFRTTTGIQSGRDTFDKSRFVMAFFAFISFSEFCFRFRRFILLVKKKKVISMNYSSSTSSWKPWRWVKLDLIFIVKDICTNSNINPLTKFSSSSRSTAFTVILP